MKNLPLAVALVAIVLPTGHGQTRSARSVELLEPTTPSEAEATVSPAIELPTDDLVVLSSRTRRVEVERPPAPGVAASRKPVDLTLEMIEEPEFPEPDLEDSMEHAPSPEELTDSDALFHDHELLVVWATVYDQSRTFLYLYPNGSPEAAVSAWTNLDFNHFLGFTKYRTTDSDGTNRAHSLLLSVNNIDTAEQRARFAAQGQESTPPTIPNLPDRSVDGPAFELIDGEQEGRAKEALDEIHELARQEGDRMAAAFLARQQEEEAAKAGRLANSPGPRQVTFRFWKRSPPSANETTAEETAR